MIRIRNLSLTNDPFCGRMESKFTYARRLSGKCCSKNSLLTFVSYIIFLKNRSCGEMRECVLVDDGESLVVASCMSLHVEVLCSAASCVLLSECNVESAYFIILCIPMHIRHAFPSRICFSALFLAPLDDVTRNCHYLLKALSI